jgi:hypothetical protein
MQPFKTWTFQITVNSHCINIRAYFILFVFSDRKISKYNANIHGLTQNFLTDLTTQSSSHSKLLKNQQFKRKIIFNVGIKRITVH